MLPAGSFRMISAGGAKMRSGAVRMLSAERFATRDSGRGGVKVDSCGGAVFMVAVVCRPAHTKSGKSESSFVAARIRRREERI